MVAHLTQLDLRAARGEHWKSDPDDPYAELLRRKGDEHEAAYLARLEVQGRSIPGSPTFTSRSRSRRFNRSTSGRISPTA
jgi:hypothetical protein